MPVRSCKLIAVAYSESGSADIEVKVNGATVYEAALTDVISEPGEHIKDYGEIGPFNIDSSLSGNIAIDITSTSSGTIYFKGIIMNNAATLRLVRATGNMSTLHPTVLPEWEDITSLPDKPAANAVEPVFGLMNLPRTVSAGDVYKVVVGHFPQVSPPISNTGTLMNNNYSMVNYDHNDNDGFSLVTLNGEVVDPFERSANGLIRGIGYFRYAIPPGGTLSFEYYLDPSILLDPAQDIQTQLNACVPYPYSYATDVNDIDFLLDNDESTFIVTPGNFRPDLQDQVLPRIPV
jgi:hypothetical protein